MRTTVLVLSVLALGACAKKSAPEPAAKEAPEATETAEAAPEESDDTTVASERVVKPATEDGGDEGTVVKPVLDEAEGEGTEMTAERGSCQAIAERIVELALEKEEEPPFRKKDIEPLTEACKAADDAEAKTAFGECLDGAKDLAAARNDCKMVATANGWLE